MERECHYCAQKEWQVKVCGELYGAEQVHGGLGVGSSSVPRRAGQHGWFIDFHDAGSCSRVLANPYLR